MLAVRLRPFLSLGLGREKVRVTVIGYDKMLLLFAVPDHMAIHLDGTLSTCGSAGSALHLRL